MVTNACQMSRKGIFAENERESAVSIPEEGIKKCKSPEATACGLFAEEQKGSLSKNGGKGGKQRSRGWSGNEGRGLESRSYVRKLRRV